MIQRIKQETWKLAAMETLILAALAALVIILGGCQPQPAPAPQPAPQPQPIIVTINWPDAAAIDMALAAIKLACQQPQPQPNPVPPLPSPDAGAVAAPRPGIAIPSQQIPQQFALPPSPVPLPVADVPQAANQESSCEGGQCPVAGGATAAGSGEGEGKWVPRRWRRRG